MILRAFGGKGGVGKTTAAAAAALAAAESGRRVLVLSTDPAHSLGDALGARLGPDPSRIPTRRGILEAAELQAPQALSRFLDEHRADLRTLAERGTYLDESDVDRLLGLTLPGADELAGLLELSRLARETEADEVVVDTAPTAHTLRLLAVPETLGRFARVLDRLQGRHRALAEHFAGGYAPDAAAAFVADLESRARDLHDLLRDPARFALTWILLPEALPLAETRDALAALADAGIPVREILVNRVLPLDLGPCPLCRARRAEQEKALREIEKAFPGIALRLIPEMEGEPRGRGGLRRVGRALTSPALLSHPPARHRERRETASVAQGGGALSRGRAGRMGEGRGEGFRVGAWLDALAPPGIRLLLFGGKGGVGKTTCAAATALALAAERPETRILLLSTDPAHSLGDVLEVPLGDDERAIPGGPPNLKAREIDAPRAFARWRDRHGETAAGALAAFTSDAGAVEDLLDLAPPGLDEIVAVATLLDAVLGRGEGEPACDLVVVDTAPTGHGLRLLETPRAALEWDHALLSLLLKYREAVGLGDLASELVALSKSLKRLDALLRDPARAGFAVVTRAAELPRRETRRLLAALGRLGIAVPAVIVNAAVPPGCPRCGSSAKEAAALARDCARLASGPCAIMEAPATFPPPRGTGGLAHWIRTWTRASG
jgi:arsenite/tail-anchored protein-transporting ATPase